MVKLLRNLAFTSYVSPIKLFVLCAGETFLTPHLFWFLPLSKSCTQKGSGTMETALVLRIAGEVSQRHFCAPHALSNISINKRAQFKNQEIVEVLMDSKIKIREVF
jgi:hypothetical protein